RRLGADVGARQTAPPGSTAPRQLTYGPLYALSARKSAGGLGEGVQRPPPGLGQRLQGRQPLGRMGIAGQHDLDARAGVPVDAEPGLAGRLVHMTSVPVQIRVVAPGGKRTLAPVAR